MLCYVNDGASVKRMPLTSVSNMPQIPETSSNAAQIEYWNATAGETWAQLQEQLDRQVELLGLAAMDVLGPREGEHILDIGCGCGQSSLALAARVPPDRCGRGCRHLGAHA
jgi:predicted TPR repeat methyltransferase